MTDGRTGEQECGASVEIRQGFFAVVRFGAILDTHMEEQCGLRMAVNASGSKAKTAST